MNTLQALGDKTAISLSVLCTIHCLALPLLVVYLPTIGALNLSDEAFHQWMVIAVIPISLFALTLGCKQHQSRNVFVLISSGLGLLLAAALFGHDLLGEAGEKALTVLAASLIAAGHLLNHRLCQLHCRDCQA